MNCPFELPAEKYEPMKIIRDKKKTYICDYKDDAYANYILKVINSHKKLTEALEEAGRDFYDIHKNTEEAHNKSYEFANKIEQVLKESEKL